MGPAAGCSQGPIVWATGEGGKLDEWKENKRKTERRRKQRRRPEGEQQVVPGSRANMERKMSEQDAVVHWGEKESTNSLTGTINVKSRSWHLTSTFVTLRLLLMFMELTYLLFLSRQVKHVVDCCSLRLEHHSIGQKILTQKTIKDLLDSTLRLFALVFLLLAADLWCWGSVSYAARTMLSEASASEQSLQVCTDQKSTMNKSSSAGAEESTWSSGQQMKMENCYPLWGLFKYMQAGEVVRSWWMPHVPAVVDMIKKIPGPIRPHPPVHHHNRQTDVARSPQAQKIACVQNCLWDEKFCLFVVRVQSCFWVQVDWTK